MRLRGETLLLAVTCAALVATVQPAAINNATNIDWQVVPPSMATKRVGSVLPATVSDKPAPQRPATSTRIGRPEARQPHPSGIGGMRAPPMSTNFDRERLVALFGSDAQPVYGNRDPTTGRITFDTVTESPARASKPAPAAPAAVEDADGETENEEVDRKDTRVPETNEINPFELLPPHFHDLLNIPIHDYGNGTTFNPYDKYKVPKVPKYPMVSSGYANTKVQGGPPQHTSPPAAAKPSPNRPDPYDYDYDNYGQKESTTKAPRTSTHKIKTTTAAPYGDYDDHYPSTKKSRPTPSTTRPTSKPYPKRPQADYEQASRPQNPPRYRPEYQEPPRYQPEAEEPPRYRPETEAPPRYRPEPENPPRYRPEPENPPRYKPEPEDPPRYRPESEDPPRHRPEPENPPRYRPEPEDPPRYRPEPEDPPRYRPDPEDGPRYRPEVQEPPRYKPTAHSSQPVREETPVYIAQSYKPPFESTEIKVTPKPFYAVDDQGYSSQPAVAGQVDDAPDIIYDYEDERAKGDGVLFMFDKPQSNQDAQSVAQPPVQSPSRPIGHQPRPQPLPTRIQPENVGSPAFRPSLPMDRNPQDAFTPKPELINGQRAPPQHPQFQGAVQQPQWPQPIAGLDLPRPPFAPQNRFPLEPQQPPQQQGREPPVVLPLFRPNAKPTEEFKFIQSGVNPAELQRPNAQGPQPISPQGRPGQRQPTQPRPPPPLQSALRSPLAQVSQAVANFFGRRSGTASTNGQQKRSTSRSASAAQVEDEAEEEEIEAESKADRTGLALREAAIWEGSPRTASEDLSGTRSPIHRFPFIGGLRPPQPDPVDRTDKVTGQVPVGPVPVGPVGIPAPAANGRPGAVANANPPAFYMYTSKELQENLPPYLVVGPQLGPPPKVEGAELVHTIPVQSISPDGQRRNDQVPGAIRPTSPNAIPFNQAPPASAEPSPTLIRRPLPNRINRPTGLAPPPSPTVLPQQQPNKPAFLFPETDSSSQTSQESIPVGISPTVSGVISPPRVPLNPQKDVATPFGDHVLLHTRPEAEPSWAQVPTASIQSVPVESIGVPSQPPSHGLQPAQSVPVAPVADPVTSKPARKPAKPALTLSSALPMMPAQSKPFSVPPAPTPVPTASQPKTTTEPTTTTAAPVTTPKTVSTTVKTRTTTAFSYHDFNQLAPVQYSTIQQEDGKQIAVVHPAYVVTYRAKPGSPDLINLDAPFLPSVEGPTSAESEDEYSLQQWHALETDRSDAHVESEHEESASNHQTVHQERSQVIEPRNPSSSPSDQPNYETGFLPFIPGQVE